MPDQTPDEALPDLEALLSSKEVAAVLDAIVGNTPSFVVIKRAPDGKVLRFSDRAAHILGWPRPEMEGRSFTELVERLPGYDQFGRPLRPSERPSSRAMRGETVAGFEFLAETAAGERIPVVVNASPICDARGRQIGVVTSATDLRPYKTLERNLRAALAQREALYQELTHRVKNHLQILSGLVSVEAADPELTAKELSEIVKGRIHALASVYDGMTVAGVGARIAAHPFLDEVCRPYLSPNVRVETEVDPPDLALTSDQAGPIGMLVNEAVCNSCKHAFPDHRGGRILASLRREKPGRLRLEIVDDGVGWGDVQPDQPSRGLELMRLFARQLHAELELGPSLKGGALVATEVPEAV